MIRCSGILGRLLPSRGGQPAAALRVLAVVLLVGLVGVAPPPAQAAVVAASRADVLAGYLSVQQIQAAGMTAGEALTAQRLAALGQKETPGGMAGGGAVAGVPPAPVPVGVAGAGASGSATVGGAGAAWGSMASLVGATAAGAVVWWKIANGEGIWTDRENIAVDPPAGIDRQIMYYPSSAVVTNKCMHMTLDPVTDWTANAIHVTLEATANTPAWPSACGMAVRWEADFVKPGGEWSHNSGVFSANGQTYQGENYGTSGFTFDPSDQWDGSAEGVELRRVAIVQDEHAWSAVGFDRGAAWGQEFPESNANRVTETTCQPDGGGATYAVRSALVGDGTNVALNIAPCGAGAHPVAVSSILLRGDGTEVLESSTNLRPDDSTGNALYPACANQVCYWTVEVNGEPCAVGKAGCVDWSNRPQDARCLFGPYTLALERCAWLERAYEDQFVPATRVNMDGAPETSDGPSRPPVTDPTGSPTPTGSPSSSPSSSPTSTSSSSPTATSSSSPTPTSSPSGNPEPCTAGAACTDPPPEQSSDCFPNGWGALNPVQWVQKPVGCALREAFIPDPQVVTDVTASIGTAVDTSGAADLVHAIGGPIDSLGSGSGCQGIEFDLPIGGQSFHGSILNACSGPMATAAHISSVLIGLSAVIGGGMALLRLAGAGFGYNVKVGDGE